MIRFACPKCRGQLKAAENQAGTKTTCPKCGHVFTLPAVFEDDEPGRAVLSYGDSLARTLVRFGQVLALLFLAVIVAVAVTVGVAAIFAR